MTFEEIILKCSSDFSFFMLMMVWVSFLLGMAWSAGKEFFAAVFRFALRKCKDYLFIIRNL